MNKTLNVSQETWEFLTKLKFESKQKSIDKTLKQVLGIK